MDALVLLELTGDHGTVATDIHGVRGNRLAGQRGSLMFTTQRQLSAEIGEPRYLATPLPGELALSELLGGGLQPSCLVGIGVSTSRMGLLLY